MATDIRTHPNGTASNADFQGFVQAIQAAITATGGMVVTADTGQINSATAANPAANTSGGYEVYKMTDSLQATKPVLLRIDYANGPNGQSHGLQLTLGLGGSDGAGNLLSPKSVVMVSPTMTPTISSTFSLRTSGAANRLTLFGGLGAAYTHVNNTPNISHFGFSVERSHNDDGTDSTDGAFLVINLGKQSYGAMTWDCQYVAFNNVFGSNTGTYDNGGSLGFGGSRLPMPWYDSGSMVAGLNVGVIPLYMPNAGVKDPSFCLAGYSTNDVSNDQIVTFTQYGAPKTYRTLGSWLYCMDNSAAMGAVNGAAAHGCMMRWE